MAPVVRDAQVPQGWLCNCWGSLLHSQLRRRSHRTLDGVLRTPLGERRCIDYDRILFAMQLIYGASPCWKSLALPGVPGCGWPQPGAQKTDCMALDGGEAWGCPIPDRLAR